MLKNQVLAGDDCCLVDVGMYGGKELWETLGQCLAIWKGVAEIVVGGGADAAGCWDLSTGVADMQWGVSLSTSMPCCRGLPHLQSVLLPLQPLPPQCPSTATTPSG